LKLQLNEGAQEAFVQGEEKFSAYIGGLGSGKTWAGIARGLKYALQPKPAGVYHAPHGLIAAVSYPALRDIIIPKLQEVMYLTGLANWEKDYKKSEKELTLKNGAIIRLRSLDRPDNIIRGPEYTWAFIDEGRNVSLSDWKLITGRLRQPGYKRMACVASTPNGFDWMYDVFHPDGSVHQAEYADGTPNEAHWYNAPMRENKFLDDDYLDMMEASYSGRWYEQEVLGRFVGLVEGGVFPEWDPDRFCIPLEYQPNLPLYSMWDFGIGDPGTCVFAQVEWRTTELSPGRAVKLPYFYILNSAEHKDWTARHWAEHYHLTRQEVAGGDIRTRGDYGDPAGLQRNPSTGTSVITDLNTAGVPVSGVAKRPQDYAIRILSNMMAAERVFVNSEGAKRVSDAFSSHKWKLDKNGVRTGETPVHDWTSHLVDAVRYGASALLPFNPRDVDEMKGDRDYEPQEYGYVFDQLTRKPGRNWLGPQARKKVTFAPTITPRS
jgi:hypothetical protein